MSLSQSLFVSSALAVPLMTIVLLACALFPRSDPGTRHAALVASFVGSLVLPLASHWLPEIALPVLAARPEDVNGGLSPVGIAVTAAALGGHRPSVGDLAAAVWLPGAALLAIRLGVDLIRARRFAARAMRRGRTIRVGRAGRTRVVFSACVSTPMTLGLFRPLVLLPTEATAWPRAERRAVLRHEFAHVRRGDGWTLLFSRLVLTLHWFNPLFWLAASRLRTSSEEACDAIVADREMAPLDYAELLLRLVRSVGSERAAGTMTALARPSRLSVRVRRLAEGGWHRVRREVMVLVGTVLVATVLLPAVLRPTFTRQSATAYAERYDIDPTLARQVLEAAAAERIAPGIAFGLVSVESGFDASRHSSSGAVGLAQILPGTASSLEPGITSDALWRPETNLRLGFRLLRGYMDSLSGDLERALLAYAVGPRNVAADGAGLDSSYPVRVLRAARPVRPPEL